MVKKYFNYRGSERKHARDVSRAHPIMRYAKALVFDWRLKRAKKKAANGAALYRKKFLVVVFDGKPVVVSMQGIKKLIRQHRFSKDFTAEKAMKCALFVAYPKY